MKICQKMVKHALVLLGALMLFESVANATVTINLSAGVLRDSAGNMMPLSGLVILVASTLDTQFGGPTATSFVSGDDIELARFDLSAPGNPGDLTAAANNLALAGSWNVGDPLAMFWFPTLTTNALVPGGGISYGFYRDTNTTTALDGSELWVTPGDGSTIGLAFLTTEDGGSNPASAGVASHYTPPLAVSDTVERYPSQGVKVAFGTLLGNDMGAGPLTLTHVSATSASGGTLATNEGWVFYSPAAGFTNVDTFTYTVSDTNGGTATGTVTINIKVETGQSVNITGIATTEGTNKLISFIGIPSRAYTIQAATNVPSTNWQIIGTSTAAGSGLFNFKDTNAYLYPMRFYRSVYP